MSLTPLAFTGISKFSSDFQMIVDRQVSIASLPVKSLQFDQQAVLEKKSAFANLRNSVGAMASSLQQLGELASGQAMSVLSSSVAVTPSLTSNASSGTFVISDISSLATTAVSTSAAGLATTNATRFSTGADRKVELLVGGVSTKIQLTEATDNLAGVRDAINALDAGVNASIIDTGATGQRYFLVLSAKQSGAQALELRTEADNAATGTMAVTTAGADASFRINGQLVTRKDNQISDAIAGVSFRLNSTATASDKITLTVKSNSGPVVTALQSFVDSYNQMAANIDAHIGKNGGVLSGDTILSDLNGRLRDVSGHMGTGGIQSLAELGITMDTNGVMSFDSTAVTNASESKLKDILTYLGSPTSGLAALADKFSEFSDPISGLIRNRITSLEETDARLTEQIGAMTERITLMQTSLMSQLQAADALLASLDSQQGVLTSTIDSLTAMTNGKKEG